jgi:hypothetical protein
VVLTLTLGLLDIGARRGTADAEATTVPAG